MQETSKETTIYPFNLILDIMDEDEESFPADIEGTVEYIISRFDPRVRKVILGRYKEGKTYEQIGSELGVSHERVRQIVDRALRQMRHSKCRNLLSLGIAEYIAQIRINAAESSANKQIAAATEVIGLVADRLSKLTGDDEISVMMEKELQKSRRTIGIEDIGVSVRSYNCLRRAGLLTVEDILNFGDLSKVQNIGQKSMDEITQKILDLGFEINLGDTI